MPGPTAPPPAPLPQPPALSRRTIVAVRITLLACALAAVVAAVTVTIRQRPQPATQLGYGCPMHPEVRTAAAGECPICHMALEPLRTGPGAKGRGDSQLNADLTAVENVRKHKVVDFARMHALLWDQRELRGPAWVDDDGIVVALLYDDQIAALGPEESGSFAPTAKPSETVTVHRIAAEPGPWDRSTSSVRFAVDRRAGGRAKPGQAGWLTLARRAREVLGVPASAVVQAPEGPYVLAWTSGFQFEKRPVELGEIFTKQGFAVVLSGLEAHARVVGKATFFIDAERRLQYGAPEQGWAIP